MSVRQKLPVRVLLAFTLASAGACGRTLPDAGPGRDGAVDPDTSVPDGGADAPPDARPDVPLACTSDRDCDDDDICNGLERCDNGRCTPGLPLECDPGDFCRVGTCEPALGCLFSLRDEDGDTFPDEACGGADCDDTRPDVNPTAFERCDNGTDDDCNRFTDCNDAACVANPACGISCPEVNLGTRIGVAVASGTTANRRDQLMGTCVPNTSPDATFRWTAPASGRWILDTVGSGYDTVLFVKSDCDGPEVACDDDGGPATLSRIVLPAREGQSFVLVVTGFGDSTGPFTLNIRRLTAEANLCDDGLDNDGDGQVDCADTDCVPDPVCCVPSPEICDNRVDENCDLRIDCDDPTCASDPACCEPRAESCTNRIDDDCDGLVDCADPNCRRSLSCCMPAPESCNNGVDDDCNGLTDCQDPICEGTPDCCVPAPELCDNGEDDDCNGLADCEDPLCQDTPLCTGGDCVPDRDLGSQLGAAVATGNTQGQGDDVSASCGATNAEEVIFAWRAPADGQYVFDTNGSSYDTVLYAYGPNCTRPELACNDDTRGLGLQSRISLFLRAGQPITLGVDGFSTSTGPFVLNIGQIDPEAGHCEDGLDNDIDGRTDCEDTDCLGDPACDFACPDQDLGMRLGTPVTMGSTRGAPNRLTASCAFNQASEITHAWIAPRSATFVFDTFGSTYDTLLYVLGPACSAPELACNDDSASLQSRVELNLNAGDAVTIVVDGYASSAGNYLLNIAATERGRCADGLDNDGDGEIDCADMDCVGAAGCCQPSREICSGGGDEDCDRLIDCADPNCALDLACCTPRPEDCQNGQDDDCDGTIDCVDRDCVASPVC